MDEARFEEIIEFAISKEQQAIDFYTNAGDALAKPHLRRILLDLAEQEKGHKRRLEGLRDHGASEVSRHIVGEIPDLKIADVTEGSEIGPDSDYQDLLGVAMKREEKAHNLYTLLASKSTEPELRELFDLLAQDEARHKLALEKEYDEHVLTDN